MDAPLRYAALAFILGRAWFRKSGYMPWVGYAYPVLAAIAGLLVMISPPSRFLLWLEPIMQKGSVGEWIALAFWLVFPLVLMAFY